MTISITLPLFFAPAISPLLSSTFTIPSPFFSPRFPSIHLTLRHVDSPHAAYCQIKPEKLIFHNNWRMCAPRAAPKFKCRSKNCLSQLRKRSGFAPPRRACQAHLGLEARVGAKDPQSKERERWVGDKYDCHQTLGMYF